MKAAYMAIAIIAIFAISLLASTSFAANFVAGDVVEVQNTGISGLKVRNSYCLSGYWDGTKKFDGTRGSVLSGPVSCDGYTWWKVRWAVDGREGWSADGDSTAQWLRKVFISPSTKFSINDRVRVTNTGGNYLIVRSEPPELADIGSAAEGTEGTVVGGPYYGISKGGGGFWHFWKISWNSITGWSAEDYLTKITTTVPSPPRNLVATAGDSRVDLSWNPPSSDGGSPITQYRLYRGTSPGTESFYAVVYGTSYANTNVQNGVTYYYKVTAYNSVGESSFSNQASATPQAPVSLPGPPTHISPADSSTVQTTTPTFTWNSVQGADYYGLYIRDINSGALVFDSEVNYGHIYGTSFTLPSGILQNNGDYRWNMRSHNSAGWGTTFSTRWYFYVRLQGVPSEPRNLAAAPGDARVDLSWQAPTSNGGSAIANYKIYRGTSSGNMPFLISAGNVLSYTDRGVTNGQTYYYQVSAVNTNGYEGAKSNVASATPQGTPPPTANTIADLIERNAANYYNPAWNVDITQFKAWIAVIARTEGGRGEFVAHSQGAPGSDVFTHSAAPNFKFSTGLGPWQLDRGGNDAWDKWTTIKKLNPEDAVKSTLNQHFVQFGAGSTLDTFARSSRWCGVNYVSLFCGKTEAQVADDWFAVTRTSWYDNKNTRRVIDWNSIRTNLNNNRNTAASYEANVKDLGNKQWDIGGDEGVFTDSGKSVILTGSRPTWRITARDGAGTALFSYYYTYDDTNGIEVWALDNEGGAYSLRHIFVRQYNLPNYNDAAEPQHISGTTAGWTLINPALISGGSVRDISVNSFTMSPLPVIRGQSANAYVGVSNLGTSTETFALQLRDETDNVGTSKTVTLSPGETKTLNFFIDKWTTRRASLGIHRVVAKVNPLAGEINTVNNQKAITLTVS